MIPVHWTIRRLRRLIRQPRISMRQITIRSLSCLILGLTGYTGYIKAGRSEPSSMMPSFDRSSDSNCLEARLALPLGTSMQSAQSDLDPQTDYQSRFPL
jgi:hypothetical protein